MKIRDNIKLVKDKDYGYLRIDPIPSAEEVEKYYLQEFYTSKYKSFNDSSLEVQKEEEEFFNSRWEAISRVCQKHFGKLEGLTLFDIGFGYAQAIIYFKEKKGMKVSGLEPSGEGVEYAKSKGLDVYQSGIEDLSCVKNKKYDVVLLMNVLEHLRNPAETIANIKNHILKPNGLLIIDIPNDFNDFQTAANAEFNLKEWWVCPPNHINYFSATSIKELLIKSGYKIEHCESSFPLELFMLFGDVYVRNQELGKICHNKRVKFESLMRKHGKEKKLSEFYKSLADLDLGRQIVVYASIDEGDN